MMKQKYYWILGIITLLGIIFVSSCIQQPTDKVTEKGFLQGKITIGPLCPEEKSPPDPRCQPTEKTYKAYSIAVYTSNRETKIANIEPNLDGTYKTELPIGNYVVDLEKRHMLGKNLPVTITIKAGETTILNIDIDTGIR